MLDCFCHCKSEINNVCNAVESLQVIKTVHHCANVRFDWLISRDQNVDPMREAITVLDWKYKRFPLVHPVAADLTTNKA